MKKHAVTIKLYEAQTGILRYYATEFFENKTIMEAFLKGQHSVIRTDLYPVPMNMAARIVR